MRILFVTNKYPPDVVGGAELIARRLADELAGRGHDITVLTSSRSRGPLRRRRDGGVDVVEVWPGTAIIPPRNLPRWRELLAQVPVHLFDLVNPAVKKAVEEQLSVFRPQVVHTHNLYGLSLAPWSAARAARVPVVHTAHDCHLICPKGILRYDETVIRQMGRLVSEAYRRSYMSRTSLVDVLCAPTEHHGDLHRRYGCRARRIEVVPNAVVGDDPRPRPPGRSPGQPLKVLYMGQLEVHKGIEVLLEALRSVPSAEVHCDIAGGGSREEAVRELAATREGVAWHGVVAGEAKDRLFAGADLLVFPSLCLESFGLAVAEALRHGLPAAVTDAGGQREIVRDGETGYLFPPGDPQALAGLLRQVAADPRELAGMGRKAGEEAGRYLAADMTDRYEKVYGWAAAAKRGAPASREEGCPDGS